MYVVAMTSLPSTRVCLRELTEHTVISSHTNARVAGSARLYRVCSADASHVTFPSKSFGAYNIDRSVERPVDGIPRPVVVLYFQVPNIYLASKRSNRQDMSPIRTLKRVSLSMQGSWIPTYYLGR